MKISRKNSTKHATLGALEHTWTFDFEDVTPEQIAELAVSHLVIRMQQKLRAGDTLDGWEQATFMVKDLIAKREAKKPTVESVAKTAAKMTQEERAALLKQLQSM